MWRFVGFFLGIGLLAFFSCSKEQFATGPVTLRFSTDTLTFDTVFTQVGSATRYFKIYNDLDKSVRIDKIYMQKGTASKFNINVDGTPGGVVEQVEIGPHDSIYVFAEVTIDPDQPPSVSPFVISEPLIIETGGTSQQVILEAWGQNANYIPSHTAAGGVAVLSCNLGTETWDDPKPYVIYGVLVIQDCTLQLPPGTRIYVHGGVALSPDTVVYSDGLLYVGENGSLQVEGTLDNPVVFQGDRLESEFDDVPGQWAGIRVGEKSRPVSFQHAQIVNSIVGIRADSATSLSLDKVQIRNTTSSALIGVHANIQAQNCLFADNGGYGIQLEYGGNYDFTYCTVANYGNEASALKIANALCLNANCDQFIQAPIHVQMKNCILAGSQKDEIELFYRTDQVPFDYQMRHCIVRVADLTKPNFFPDFFDHCNPCTNMTGTDKLFANVDEQDYHPDTLSIAEGRAMPVPAIPDDIEEQLRDPNAPDIGCYERQ